VIRLPNKLPARLALLCLSLVPALSSAQDPQARFSEALAAIEEERLITARREGYTPVEHQFKLPPSSRRLLIILAPGPDRLGDPDSDDPMRQYERYR